ncbi:MAG: M56 family metallopeptidase [Verrucomicrobiota bacterium]|jgi:beta-lactamase regulating signal transducer with metallopeptidase domain
MKSWIEPFFQGIQNFHFTALFLDMVLKSFVVLALAGGVCALLRRSSAATRHLIWLLAVASLPCLPLLALVLPSWQKPLWSVATGFDSGNQVSLTLELAPGTRRVAFAQKPQTSPAVAGASDADHGSSSSNREFAARFSTNWVVFGLVVWFAGAVLVLISVTVGHIRLREFSRKAQPLRGADWTLLLKKACETLRLPRAVNLLQSTDNVMPLTWGWWHPVVLLPAEAGQWPLARRRIVLLHELAHVKRWDCLTQFAAKIVCAFYWFNPLAWLAARRMCVERERACDDLVLNAGCKASDYAGHLVEIAGRFRCVPQVAAIAMARSSQLEGRVAAIVDASRNRRLRSATAMTILAVVAGIAIGLGGSETNSAGRGANESQSLREQQIARLEAFSVAKEKQSQTLAAAAGEKITPEFQRFFDAATRGDWQTVTNMFESFKQRHPQYERVQGVSEDVHLRTSYWSPVLEICLAYGIVVNCEPKYTQMVVDDITSSIPPGSIYFGGTDPGRGLPTAFSKSQIDGDPFYTLTQNALADGTYLEYLRKMYGGKIYMPTDEDLQKCFQDYTEDAQKRLQNHQLKPGEDFKPDANGKLQVSGQIAVVSINGLMVKLILDKNPDRRFYIEESFPFDWMYPHLEPHGLIMKINRQPLPELSVAIVEQDHNYWRSLVRPMIGGWLNDDTPVEQVAAFAKKAFGKQNFSGFTGDSRFVQNAYAHRTFSKLRSSLGGLYAWRTDHAADVAEKERMSGEADFAFRQAWALCPDSPEAVFRYVNFLLKQKRISDALLVAETAAQMPSMQGKDGDQLRDLFEQLQKFQKAN